MINVQENSNAQVEPNGPNTPLLDHNLARQPLKKIAFIFVNFLSYYTTV